MSCLLECVCGEVWELIVIWSPFIQRFSCYSFCISPVRSELRCYIYEVVYYEVVEVMICSVPILFFAPTLLYVLMVWFRMSCVFYVIQGVFW